MPKIFLLVSVALLLGSAGLSFVNKGKLAAVQTDLKTSKSTVTMAQNDATKARTDLKKAQNDLKDATQKAADAQTQLTAAQGQAAKAETDLKAANDAVAAKDAQLAELNKTLASIPKTAGADPGEGIAKQIEDLKRQRDELQVVKDGLQTQFDSAQKQTAALSQRLRQIEDKSILNGVRGRVLAVDRQWNFVVIDLGVNRGVSSNTTMVISRGGELVGKVRITSVEPSQSIADIIPNSVPSGVSVQAGDTVYFPGT